MQTLDSYSIHTFPVVSIGTIFSIVIVTPVTHILHFTISIVRTPGTITVSPIVVAAVIFAGRVIAATRWSWTTSSTARRTTTTWTAVTTRVKAPRGRGRSTSPLWRVLAWNTTYTPAIDLPRSSTDHLARDACYASHDRHHLRHVDSHIPQRQTYLSC